LAALINQIQICVAKHTIFLFSIHESYNFHVAIRYDSSILTCSALELVDAAVDPSLLEPIKETIVKADGVKVQY
jgi:hypothetical protein